MIKNFFINNEKNRIDWVSKKLKKLKKWESILDAGAWEEQYKTYCSHLNYTSQDFNKYDWKWDWKWLQKWEWIKNTDITSDIVNIPVEKESYDNILCTEVLEHLPNPNLAIKEFSRIIKKWWNLVLTAPFCSLTHFAPYHYSTGFNEYWYKHHLEENGFEITELSKNWNYFDYLEQETIRIPSMTKKFTNTNFLLIFLIKISSFIQILILKYLSKKDKWSNEILCFGIHILAVKK